MLQLIYKLMKKAFEISPILKFYVSATVLSAGVLPVITTLLMQMVTYCLTKEHAELSLYVGSLVFFLLLSITFKCIYIYTESKADNRCTFVRMTIENQLNEKVFGIAYQELEDQQYINEKYPMFQSLSSSSFGVEGMLHDFLIGAGNVLSIVGLLGMIGMKCWIMIPVCVLYLSMGCYVSYRNSSRLQKYRRQETEINKSVDYIFQTANDHSYVKDLRIFQVEKLLKTKFSEKIQELKKLYGVFSKHHLLHQQIWLGIAAGVCMLFCFVSLVFMSGQNQATADTVTACFYAVLNLYICSQNLFDIVSRMTRESFAVGELLEYIEEPVETKRVIAGRAAKAFGQRESYEDWEWEVNHLSYRYPNAAQPALKDINFQLRRGENTAIVGLNGAGKSTLIKCMAGLYQDYEGTILWRGKDVRTLAEEERSQALGVLFQDADIYPFRVVENIASRSEGYDLGRVEKCLEKVGLKSKLYAESKTELEQLYLTKLFDVDGIELSGGEAQKLMIARLIYQNPEIALLDEVTSKMDVQHEEEMLRLLFETMKEKSLLFVTHHLSVASKMNRILVMKDGRILEDGSHETLLTKKGEYYRMYMLEKEYYCQAKAMSKQPCFAEK